MEGVTTAIVAFILLCVVYPRLVKNKPQYYGAGIAVLLIILLDALARVVSPGPQVSITPGGSNGREIVESVLHAHAGFFDFAYAMTGLLQVAAIVLLILSAGGLTVTDLASDIGKTIDVIRRGGEKETIIVPIGNQKRRVKPHLDPDIARQVDEEIANDSVAPASAAASAAAPPVAVAPERMAPPDTSSIPLDE